MAATIKELEAEQEEDEEKDAKRERKLRHYKKGL
jgi:hypothetical protein